MCAEVVGGTVISLNVNLDNLAFVDNLASSKLRYMNAAVRTRFESQPSRHNWNTY